MSWNGYFTIDGIQLINAPATEERVESKRVPWLRRRFENKSLGYLLDQTTIAEPVAGMPWQDPRVPWASEFYGVLPLEITGVDDSTLASVVAEQIGEGAASMGRRWSSKSMVFSVVLLASSARGAEYGVQWLKRALLGRWPSGHGGGGVTLGFLAAEPLLMGVEPEKCGAAGPGGAFWTPQDAVQALGRTFRGVEVTASPIVTSQRQTSDGWHVLTVTFTLVATKPAAYGVERLLLEGLNVSGRQPWSDGGPPAGASISALYPFEHEECLKTVYSPVYDPLNPTVLPPPAAAGVSWSSYQPPVTWNRQRIVLPASIIPGWTTVVPVIRFNVGDEEARNIRLRFHLDPGFTGDVELGEECSHVADMVVTYVPTGTSMVIDGADRAIYVETTDGVRRRSDSLVVGSGGGIFRWPELTGGVQHILTIDTDPAEVVPWMDVSLVEKIL